MQNKVLNENKGSHARTLDAVTAYDVCNQLDYPTASAIIHVQNRSHFAAIVSAIAKREGKRFTVEHTDVENVYKITRLQDREGMNEFQNYELRFKYNNTQDYEKAKRIIALLTRKGNYITCRVNDMIEFIRYIKLLTPAGRFYAVNSITYLSEIKVKVQRMR